MRTLVLVAVLAVGAALLAPSTSFAQGSAYPYGSYYYGYSNGSPYSAITTPYYTSPVSGWSYGIVRGYSPQTGFYMGYYSGFQNPWFPSVPGYGLPFYGNTFNFRPILGGAGPVYSGMPRPWYY